METKELKKNNVYTAPIEGYSSEGFGVARINGRAVFVPFAKKGQEYEIKILKISNTACYGKLSSRPETDCPYFGICGGCQLRHLSYEEELEFKLEKVNSALKRIGGQSVQAEKITGSDSILRYRNKAVFNVQEDKFGFYRPRTHELIEIEDCLLQKEEALRIAREVEKPGLNHIFIRDTVCTLAGPEYSGPIPSGITGLVLCNNRRENSIIDGRFKTLWGSAEQEEALCGLKFIISPQSFFQVNPPQAEKLYFKALEYAGTGRQALELYCGAGTISMLLARSFERVTAAEIVPEAIENAKRNAELNGVNNIDFICADAKDIKEKGADVVLVDPPRKGMSIETISELKRIAAERIVYVSCNPATLARDIKLLEDEYELKKVEVFDMFPRTHHVETVVLMQKM